MAALKRNRRTGFLILILAVGLFALREKLGLAARDLTIAVPTTFASLDGSAADADGLADGVLTVTGNLTITTGGSITCNDPSAPTGDSACPIRIAVSGNMEIQAGGSILAENNLGGGSGANIDVSVAGNVTLRAAGVDPGALISSSKNVGPGGTGAAGDITITLGNSDFTMETGSRILANSVNRGGAIVIDGVRTADIEGLVQSRNATPGPAGGGPITIKASCSLLVGDTGSVSSEGSDAGADLVHLQACNVTIDGVVQSTGPGHLVPTPANHCDSGGRPDKPSNSTACVEIWGGDSVTINAAAPHTGQVNADIGTSGGTTGHSWIDVLARGSITILGNPAAPFAVHANMTLPNGHAGAITILSRSGAVATSGLAVQASDQTIGSSGGGVVIQAGGAGSPAGELSLGTAAIEARGATSGASPAGGQIFARSFNAAITGASPGSLNASGDGVTSPGTVTLEACTGAFYTGAVTPPPTILAPVCGGAPAFQAYVSLPPAGCCALSTPTATNTPTPAATSTPTNPPTDTPTSTPTPTPTSTPVPPACVTAPTAFVSGDTTICAGDSTTIQASLTGTPPWNLVWSDGFAQSVSASPATRTVSPTTTTTYKVTAISDAACPAGAASGNAKVKVQPIPSSAITAPASVCANSPGHKASVPNAGGQATYAWSISNGTITADSGSKIKFTAGGPAGSSVSITVTVTTPDGCTSSSTITIPINC